MLRVHFNDLSDEQDSLQRCECGLAFELEERAHQGVQNHRNRLREGLSDLVDRLDEKVAILVRHGALRAVLVHLGSFDDLTLQELNHLLDIALADEVCDEVEHFLIDLQRDNSVIFDDSQDVGDVVLQHFDVVLAEGKDLLEDDHLHIVVVVLLEQAQVALDCNFDRAWRRCQLCDSIGAFKEHTGALRRAHHEDGVHEAGLLTRV